jgi:hypothetical protein
MEQLGSTQRVQPCGNSTPVTTCAHGRLIDDVLTKRGQRTGRVRCLECGVIFDDPYYRDQNP